MAKVASYIAVCNISFFAPPTPASQYNVLLPHQHTFLRAPFLFPAPSQISALFFILNVVLDFQQKLCFQNNGYNPSKGKEK